MRAMGDEVVGVTNREMGGVYDSDIATGTEVVGG